MASPTHFDDEFDFGGGFGGRHSASKRSSPDYDDEDYDNDPFARKKAQSKAEEASGVTTGMILSLRESLQNCKDTLVTCQNELEAAKSEIQSWHSTLKNEPSVPAGITPDPKMLINHLQTLKTSEESLREQSAVWDLKVQLKPPSMQRSAAGKIVFCFSEMHLIALSNKPKFNVRSLGGTGHLCNSLQMTATGDSVVDSGTWAGQTRSHQARRLLLDPAVHEEFTRLKNLVEEKDKKVKELQDNIAAMNFTPQSKMGKMLMAKCRTLQEENEEIGNQASEGKIHELALKLALQKSQNSQLRSQFEGLQKHMEGLTNDVERSNETVLMLQDKLEEKDREIQRLKHELQQKNLEDARSDAALTRNDNNETMAGEAAN
ncbi:hypothetical protein ACSQ67_025701 [Phaseolus vulgaris]